ncbi:ras-related protein rab-3d [Plakobranchus ocellatus]|uniref:Ras-related protein rab-3d n=1 Tax=Plakobranchus ocellatus TaxID=259542 RepID=A0AAV4C495_9GAST|nr:ras-related protein rab-3d [Plakobranchus ocellatus]
MIRRSSFPLSQFDYTVKIILLGDHSVGKTSFLSQLATDNNNDAIPCRCLHFRQNCQVELEVTHHGKRILVKIADTGGQERFRSITASYYRGAQGCLVMFDAERAETFSHVYDWNNDLEMYTNRQFLSKFLVGVNFDSSRKQVTSEQASRLASQLEMQFHDLDPRSRKSTVGVVIKLLDLVMVTVQRLPSLTIDIRPGQVTELDASQKQNGRRWGLRTNSVASDIPLNVLSGHPPHKMKCSC